MLIFYSIFNGWQKGSSTTSYLKNIQNEKYGTPHGPFPFMVESTTAKNLLPLTSLCYYSFHDRVRLLNHPVIYAPYYVLQFLVLLGKELHYLAQLFPD